MKKYFIVSLLVVLSLVLTGMANAASTIGTNMSTTGTFTQTVDSATAARFQNAAGDLTVLHVDTATGTGRVGVGAAPSTTFEVQGTASASYFFTQNTIQVAGVPGATASVAYSRFGTATTGYSTVIDASNDLLITGALEVDGTVFFDGKASVSGNFETAGRIIARSASHSFIGDLAVNSALVVGATTASASVGNGYTAEFVGPATATASFYFAGSGVTGARGTCFQLKSTTGAWIYMRFVQGTTTPTLSTVRCH